MEGTTNKKDQTKKAERALTVTYIAIAHAADRLHGLLRLLQPIPENGANVSGQQGSVRDEEESLPWSRE